jgi:F-type H+-transporting ATPase subunit b
MKGGFILDLTALSLLAAVPEGRLFGLDAQTLFIFSVQLLNACILATALSYILYKPVQNFLQRRADKIQGQLDQAASEMAEASKLKHQYETSLREIEQERGDILAEAYKQAADKQREMIYEARKDSEALREQARADVQREQEHIQEALRMHIIDVSSVMAEKFITKNIDKETQDRLFAETLHELEEAAWPS